MFGAFFLDIEVVKQNSEWKQASVGVCVLGRGGIGGGEGDQCPLALLFPNLEISSSQTRGRALGGFKDGGGGGGPQAALAAAGSLVAGGRGGSSL